MFCSDIFLSVIKNNFTIPTNCNIVYHYPTHSVDKNDLVAVGYSESDAGPFICAYEEPLSTEILESFDEIILDIAIKNNHIKDPRGMYRPTKFLINSEHSQLKKTWLKKAQAIDWYLFYHGFAALHWFNRFQYLPKSTLKFTHIFINYNHFVTEKRSYRLNFLAQILDKNLDDVGLISMPSMSESHLWKKEIFNPNTLLSKNAKILISKQFKNLKKNFTLDHENIHGALSADINQELNARALFQVVSETVFYEEKLHLTEKIFKPIVCRQPFMLLAAPGNLNYLKSYGFQTFDRWIDESYDNEPDPDLRIKKVVMEIEKLSRLSYSQLDEMHNEMQEILDFNFYHFYTNFKKKIVNEMIDNFEKALNIFNYDTSERFRINYLLDLKEIRNRFLL